MVADLVATYNFGGGGGQGEGGGEGAQRKTHKQVRRRAGGQPAERVVPGPGLQAACRPGA